MADPKGQQANPREQRMFETATQQAAKVLTSEQGARAIYREAKTSGADVAIANAVKQAIQAIAQAAGGKGVQIPPDVLLAAMQAVAQVLVALMVQAKMAPNPDELMAAVMQRLQGATA